MIDVTFGEAVSERVLLHRAGLGVVEVDGGEQCRHEPCCKGEVVMGDSYPWPLLFSPSPTPLQYRNTLPHRFA